MVRNLEEERLVKLAAAQEEENKILDFYIIAAQKEKEGGKIKDFMEEALANVAAVRARADAEIRAFRAAGRARAYAAAAEARARVNANVKAVEDTRLKAILDAEENASRSRIVSAGLKLAFPIHSTEVANINHHLNDQKMLRRLRMDHEFLAYQHDEARSTLEAEFARASAQIKVAEEAANVEVKAIHAAAMAHTDAEVRAAQDAVRARADAEVRAIEDAAPTRVPTSIHTKWPLLKNLYNIRNTVDLLKIPAFPANRPLPLMSDYNQNRANNELIGTIDYTNCSKFYNRVVNGNNSFTIRALIDGRVITPIPFVMYWFNSSNYTRTIDYYDRDNELITFQVETNQCPNDKCLNDPASVNSYFCHKIFINSNFDCIISKVKLNTLKEN